MTSPEIRTHVLLGISESHESRHEHHPCLQVLAKLYCLVVLDCRRSDHGLISPESSPCRASNSAFRLL